MSMDMGRSWWRDGVEEGDKEDEDVEKDLRKNCLACDGHKCAVTGYWNEEVGSDDGLVPN